MKGVLLASSLIISAVPALACAQESTETSRIEQSVQVASSYMFEKQAAIVSTNPVANYSLTVNLNDHVSGYVWAQVGDVNGREMDVGLDGDQDLGPITVRGSVAAYLYPDGFATIYTASVGVTAPLGPLEVAADIQRYAGGFDSTLVSVDVSGSVGPVRLTLGHAWNSPEDLNPWYARASVPLGQSARAPTFGVRTFFGAGSGIAVDLTARW